jgi:hypothetical protein
VLSTGAESAVQSLIQGAIVALGMGLRNVPWSRLLTQRRRGRLLAGPTAAEGSAAVSMETTRRA